MEDKHKPTNVKDMTPVSDIDCELRVVGTLLANTKAIDEVRTIIDRECFTERRAGEIYESIRDVDADGDAIDPISVLAKLAKKGSCLTAIDVFDVAQHSTVGELDYYAYRLKELALRRRLWNLGHTLVTAGTTETDELDEVMEKAQDSVSRLFDFADTRMTDLREVYDKELKQVIEANRKSGGKINGSPTGFYELDRRGGLCHSDLIIVAGESSNGKTSLATAFMLSAANAGHDVAVYSMEMTAVQIAARIASMQTGLSTLCINQSMLTQSQTELIDRSMDSIDLKRIHLDDRATSSIDNILSSIRSMKIKHDIKGAVIDYLQILNVNRGRNYNKEQAMGDAARRLKNLAKELDIWIVALSQLSRDRDRPEPDMNRLRDSGQIAEAADVVMLVWRPEVKGDGRSRYSGEYEGISTAGTAMINVAKGRNIGTFRFICGFDAQRTLFYPLTQLPRRSAGESVEPSKLEVTSENMPF